MICAAYHEGKLRYEEKIETGFDESEIKKILEKLEKLKAEKYLLDEEPKFEFATRKKTILNRDGICL